MMKRLARWAGLPDPLLQCEELRFLQIWIEPNQRGGTPGYQQKDFGMAPGLTLVASGTGSAT